MSQRKREYPEPHEREAARRYLEHDYAASHLSGRARREGNRNASEIDEQHPRARDIAMTGTRRELGELPKHLKEHQQQLRRHAGITSEESQRIRHEYRSGPYQEDEAEEPEREPGRRDVAGAAARRGGELVASGAGQVADTGWGGLIGQLFLWGMALSIGYLMLTRVAGVSKLWLGATNVARAVVSPVVDPLNPRSAL
jgi:hypothetical protein